MSMIRYCSYRLTLVFWNRQKSACGYVTLKTAAGIQFDLIDGFLSFAVTRDGETVYSKAIYDKSVFVDKGAIYSQNFL